jgi:NitT/TauT family transport system substrate-binding protein
VSDHSDGHAVFQSQRFMDFPTMKEAFIARRVEAAFVNVPLGMKLALDGVPTKIVYLGHRDGTVLMVHKQSPYKTFADLSGKRIAIPSRFSNQAILMHRMTEKSGMRPEDVILVEMPPPDMPSALASRSIDGYIVGEPHAARAEIGSADVAGWGRPLYFAKDLWPNFISCGLIVRRELIDAKPQLVEELVRGIAASGKWLDSDIGEGARHRREAAVVAGQIYYNQDPRLLEFVLTKPLDRVRYTDLKPVKRDFDEIMELGLKYGVFDRRIEFHEYVDNRFAPDLGMVRVWWDHLPTPTAEEIAGATRIRR